MKRITARFYLTVSGGDPVREWLIGLDPADRKIVGTDIARVEYGWPIGMPTCGPLGRGLFEVRSTISNGKVEARVYFHIAEGLMLLLNGHIGKNSQDESMALARSRLSDHKARQFKKRKDKRNDRDG